VLALIADSKCAEAFEEGFRKTSSMLSVILGSEAKVWLHRFPFSSGLMSWVRRAGYRTQEITHGVTRDRLRPKVSPRFGFWFHIIY